MNARTRVATLVVTVGGGLVVAAGGSVAQAAAPAAPAPVGSDRAGGTAPACISRVVDEQSDGQHVFVTNNCGKTMHIKIIVHNAPDTGCNTLGAGKSREWILTLGFYDRTVVC